MRLEREVQKPDREASVTRNVEYKTEGDDINVWALCMFVLRLLKRAGFRTLESALQTPDPRTPNSRLLRVRITRDPLARQMLLLRDIRPDGAQFVADSRPLTSASTQARIREGDFGAGCGICKRFEGALSSVGTAAHADGLQAFDLAAFYMLVDPEYRNFHCLIDPEFIDADNNSVVCFDRTLIIVRGLLISR